MASNELFLALFRLAGIDGDLARLRAELKKRHDELSAIERILQKKEKESSTQRAQFNDRKTRLAREEKSIAEEQEKLVSRRKALASLNNYKVQQAAEREIEFNGRQLTQREEGVLKTMTEMQALEADVVAVETKLKAEREQFEKQAKEFTEESSGTETRIAKLVEERQQVSGPVPIDPLRLYNRTAQRFPMDPVVVVRESTCGGCFMSIGPQILVQIARREKLILCPGCQRILVLNEMVGTEQPPAAAK